MRLSILAALLSLLGACSPDPLPFAAAGKGVVADPSKPGPFPVGVRTVTWEDTGRKTNGVSRTLVTEVWYPATQATRGQPGEAYDISTYFTDEQRALIGTAAPLLPTAAVRDAPLATSHGPFPVVVFSHGQGAVRWQSTFYTVVLASHGYVVLSMDHQGGTLAELVRDTLGDVVDGVEDRPADVRYLLNRLERLKQDDPLFGAIDLARVGVTGHSFGALTALRVAVLDPRVKAIVPQAPTSADVAWIALPGPPSLSIPVEIQGGHDDRTLKWDSNTGPAFASMRRPRWLLDLLHGGHFTFSDLCTLDLASLAERARVLPGTDVRKALSDGCLPPAPAVEVSQPLMNHFAIGFFNAWLRGSDGSLALLDQAHADALAPGVSAVTADP